MQKCRKKNNTLDQGTSGRNREQGWGVSMPWALIQVWGHHPPPNGVDGAASTVEQSVGHQLDTPVDVAVGGWVGGC